MNTVTNTAILQFYSDTGKNIRISIPRANIDVNEADARAAMEGMIAGGAIVTTFGRPASVKHMEVVTTTRTNLI